MVKCLLFMFRLTVRVNYAFDNTAKQQFHLVKEVTGISMLIVKILGLTLKYSNGGSKSGMSTARKITM